MARHGSKAFYQAPGQPLCNGFLCRSTALTQMLQPGWNRTMVPLPATVRRTYFSGTSRDWLPLPPLPFLAIPYSSPIHWPLVSFITAVCPRCLKTLLSGLKHESSPQCLHRIPCQASASWSLISIPTSCNILELSWKEAYKCLRHLWGNTLHLSVSPTSCLHSSSVLWALLTVSHLQLQLKPLASHPRRC